MDNILCCGCIVFWSIKASVGRETAIAASSMMDLSPAKLKSQGLKGSSAPVVDKVQSIFSSRIPIDESFKIVLIPKKLKCLQSDP